MVAYQKWVTLCFIPPLMKTTAWLLKCLAIINQFWLVKFGNRINMSTPSHKGFFSRPIYCLAFENRSQFEILTKQQSCRSACHSTESHAPQYEPLPYRNVTTWIWAKCRCMASVDGTRLKTHTCGHKICLNELADNAVWVSLPLPPLVLTVTKRYGFMCNYGTLYNPCQSYIYAIGFN